MQNVEEPLIIEQFDEWMGSILAGDSTYVFRLISKNGSVNHCVAIDASHRLILNFCE